MIKWSSALLNRGNCKKAYLQHLCRTFAVLTLNCHHTVDTPKLQRGMEYTPAPIGVEVRGIDLKQPVPQNIVEQIKKDVHKHRLLIFKDQGVISADRHVEISQWFGELESTFYKHPKSPHPDVFRVSNNEVEGCTNVGRTGWHIDGSFMEKPFSFALYHMVSVPKIGNTGKILRRYIYIYNIYIYIIYIHTWQGMGGTHTTGFRRDQEEGGGAGPSG